MAQIKVTTNPQQNSKKKVTINKVTFEELWKNYPKNKSDYQHNAKEIKDYCAIKVSISLIKSNIQLKGSFKGAFCWGCKDGGIHAIRAHELANWLKKRPFAGCPKVEIITGKEFRKKLNERTGIVFFKDYWQRNADHGENRTGDHIDLWDGRGLDKLASQDALGNFLGNTLGLYLDGIYSDKNKSKEVWFWEIK